MAPWLFRSLLLAVTLYALFRGGRDERAVALVCVAGTIATMVVISPLVDRFEQIELGVVLVDVAVFAGFLAVALRSERFWPLWVAGLQLTAMLGHSLKGIDPNIFHEAYGAALNFWAYPIIVILAVGTWRSHGRSLDQTNDRTRFT